MGVRPPRLNRGVRRLGAGGVRVALMTASSSNDRAVLLKKIIFALRAFPGIARAERTDEYAGHCDQRTGEAFAFCLMLDPERSGDTWG